MWRKIERSDETKDSVENLIQATGQLIGRLGSNFTVELEGTRKYSRASVVGNVDGDIKRFEITIGTGGKVERLPREFSNRTPIDNLGKHTIIGVREVTKTNIRHIHFFTGNGDIKICSSNDYINNHGFPAEQADEFNDRLVAEAADNGARIVNDCLTALSNPVEG